MKDKVLIIGAGLAGISAARLLAESGFQVDIHESLSHIGGNLYDYKNKGAYVHKYGPHIWHTTMEDVHEFVSRFTEMTDNFSHNVVAITEHGYLPYPISLESAKEVLSIRNRDEFYEYLNDFVTSNPRNMEEAMISKVGPTLYELYVKGYTTRQWGRTPAELSPDLAKRVVVGDSAKGMFDHEAHCTMPKYGYTSMLESMADHPNIKIHLNMPHTIESLKAYQYDYDYVLISAAIDKLYEHSLDYEKLPYVYVTFNHMEIPRVMINPKASVYNHCVAPSETESNGESLSRVTIYNMFNNSEESSVYSVGTEVPSLTSTGDNIPCYPITTYDRDKNVKLYLEYADKVKSDLSHTNVHFIGRLGTYSYLDMDKTIKLSMSTVNNIINNNNK